MRAFVLACLLRLALAEIEINVDMLIPTAIGWNISTFSESLASWSPPLNTSAGQNIPANITTPRTGFFVPFNIKVALAGLNNILCVTGFNVTQCYTDLPKPTPTPIPAQDLVGASSPLPAPVIAAIASASLITVLILAAIILRFIYTRRRSAQLTKLVMRCIIRETIDWPPKKTGAQRQRAPPRMV